MVEFVLEHFAMPIQQRRQHAKTGHVAGGKQQRGGQADKFGQLDLQLVMQTMMPGQQMRRARADAAALRRAGGSGGNGRMIGETEVIVAGKGQIRLAIQDHPRALRAIQYAPHPAQRLGVEFG